VDSLIKNFLDVRATGHRRFRKKLGGILKRWDIMFAPLNNFAFGEIAVEQHLMG